MIEEITEAQTLAVIERAIPLPAGLTTGTGTDCICLASALDGPPQSAAGKHTALGEAVGHAALSALCDVIARWQDPQAASA